MTTNAGADIIRQMDDGNSAMRERELWNTLTDELRRVFKPALLARMIVVPYNTIGDTVLHQIVELKLGKIQQRLLDSHGSRCIIQIGSWSKL
jgi:type VI secretion system protein VasG